MGRVHALIAQRVEHCTGIAEGLCTERGVGRGVGHGIGRVYSEIFLARFNNSAFSFYTVLR